MITVADKTVKKNSAKSAEQDEIARSDAIEDRLIGI